MKPPLETPAAAMKRVSNWTFGSPRTYSRHACGGDAAKWVRAYVQLAQYRCVVFRAMSTTWHEHVQTKCSAARTSNDCQLVTSLDSRLLSRNPAAHGVLCVPAHVLHAVLSSAGCFEMTRRWSRRDGDPAWMCSTSGVGAWLARGMRQPPRSADCESGAIRMNLYCSALSCAHIESQKLIVLTKVTSEFESLMILGPNLKVGTLHNAQGASRLATSPASAAGTDSSSCSFRDEQAEQV